MCFYSRVSKWLFELNKVRSELRTRDQEINVQRSLRVLLFSSEIYPTNDLIGSKEIGYLNTFISSDCQLRQSLRGVIPKMGESPVWCKARCW